MQIPLFIIGRYLRQVCRFMTTAASAYEQRRTETGLAGIESAVEGLVKVPVEALGFELVEVSFKKEGGVHVLTVYIDKEGGVTMDDCVLVNNTVEPLIDEADPVPMAYTFSVSSPGIDRPIVSERDFARNMGKPVVVKLYKARDKKKEFVGDLIALSDSSVSIAQGSKTIEFERREVALIKPHIIF